MAQLIKNLPVMRETWVDLCIRKIPWRRESLPTPVFWPGEFHGLYRPWGRKELEMTKQFSHIADLLYCVTACVQQSKSFVLFFFADYIVL